MRAPAGRRTFPFVHTVMASAGALLGGGLGLIARRGGPQRELRVLAAGLVVAALLYVGFAAVGRAGLRWLAIEAAGLIPFGALAWAGVRRSPLWLAAGWALHVAWDVGLHSATGTPFVPAWYPALCVGLDIVVALWVALRRRELTALPAAGGARGP